MKVSGGSKSGSASKAGAGRSASKSSKKSQDQVPSLSPLTSSGGVDALQVSDHVSTIELIKSIVNETPDIRMNEVERVSNKLKSGKYKIDLEKIAEAFIKDVIENEISKKSGRARKR